MEFEGSLTYSYYFVTSGLAFMALLAFIVICDVYRCEKLMKPLEMAGKNPMIAYILLSICINSSSPEPL